VGENFDKLPSVPITNKALSLHDLRHQSHADCVTSARHAVTSARNAIVMVAMLGTRV